MKKNTLEAIRNYLNGDESVDLSTLRKEVNEEWNRLNAKKEANQNMYADARKIAFEVLDETPRTVKELFNMTTDWPQGFTQAKLQYALLRYWCDDVHKHDGEGRSPKMYSI